MRVTNNLIYYTILENVRKPAQRLLEEQTQVATGKRINRHADDPLGAGRTEKLRGQRASVRQYQENADSALLWMRQTEAVIDRLESNLMRAKALAVQGANSTNSADERQVIAAEVNQILEDILSIANTQFQGKYLFAGQNTNVRPFTERRDERNEIEAIMLGDDHSGSIRREVDQGVFVDINIPGTEIFNLKDGPLATLIALRDRLQSNDVEGIQKSIDAVQTALETSLNARTGLGARMNRVEATEAYLQTHEVNLTSAISDIEDADVAEMAMRIAADDVGYRAALGAASTILRTSLVDFLT